MIGITRFFVLQILIESVPHHGARAARKIHSFRKVIVRMR